MTITGQGTPCLPGTTVPSFQSSTHGLPANVIISICGELGFYKQNHLKNENEISFKILIV